MAAQKRHPSGATKGGQFAPSSLGRAAPVPAPQPTSKSDEPTTFTEPIDTMFARFSARGDVETREENPELPVVWTDRAAGAQRWISGDCWAFATALHKRTGWKTVTVQERAPEVVAEMGSAPMHALNRHPSGGLVDASGFVSIGDLACRYGLRDPDVVDASPEQLADIGGTDEDDVEDASEYLDQFDV